MYETDCDEVLRNLEAFLDGELPADRAAVVGEHLEGCSPCLGRQDFRIHLRVIVARKCGAVADLPPHLEERVRRAINEEAPG